MALKLKISKADFGKLPADIQAEYDADGDSYKLNVDGLEDTGALRRAKDREAQGRKDAEARANELQAELDALGMDPKKKADIAALERSWGEKLEQQKAGDKAKIDKHEAYIKSLLVDGAAEKMAREISTSPALITPHIKARLVADLTGETPSTRILGKDGKVDAALKLEDLQKELIANPDFKAIIIASKASGGGTPARTTQQLPASGGTNGDKPANLAVAAPADLLAHINAVKATQGNGQQ